MRHRDDNWNDVKGSRDKLISTLWKEKGWFARDINELEKKVKQLGIGLKIEHMVLRVMHAELERAKENMKRLQEDKKMLPPATNQVAQQPAGSKGVVEIGGKS